MGPATTRGIRAGIRRLFRLRPRGLRRIAADIDEEIRFHLDLRVEQLVAQGVAPEAARREALDRFGSLDEARRTLRHSAERREEHLRMRETLEALWQDLRYASRGIRRRPGFAAAVVATLALGIGANATMFGVVDRLLLRPPALLSAPDETGRLYLIQTWEGKEFPTSNMAYRRYLDLRERTTSFSQMAAFFNTELIYGAGEEARGGHTALVSASFWPLFGVRPALGRFFTAAEDSVPLGTPVAVLGYGYWQSQFGGDPGVLGTKLRIGTNIYEIIGVAPRGFSGMSASAVSAFVPITAAVDDIFPQRGSRREPWFSTYNMTWMEAIARRKPGVTAEAATADLSRVFRESVAAQVAAQPGRMEPVERTKPRAVFGSIILNRGPTAGQNAKVATWLAAVSALVLLIACANVANLMLARAVQRQREIAVRVALGVSRRRLLGQLLVESVVLAMAGGAAGVLLAHWGGGVLRSLLLPGVEWTGAIFDLRTLGFAALAAAGAGLLTGLVPALQQTHPDVVATLKAGGREGSLRRSRVRTGLLVLQGAVSVLLLVGAGLFVRSLHNVRSLDLGYDPDPLIFVNLEMRGTALDSAGRTQLRERLVERAGALPGVVAVGRTMAVPFWMTWSENVFVPGIDTTELRGEWFVNAVSPGYFDATGTRVLRGRGIQRDDGPGGQRVVVVSEATAKAIWKDADPLGRCVKTGSDTVPCMTVVGVVENIRRSFQEDDDRHLYMSITQHGGGGGGLFVRTDGDARGRVETVRRELQKLMPGTAYIEARSLREIVDPNIRSWRMGATMFTLFGVLALLVASVGLYSVIAYGVAQRTHELGVRIALGARAADVVRMVVGEGTRVAVVGVALGLTGALVAARWVAPLLYDVSAKDPAIYLAVAAVLLLVAVTASLIPALRASRVDPNVALRAD